MVVPHVFYLVIAPLLVLITDKNNVIKINNAIKPYLQSNYNRLLDVYCNLIVDL